MIDRTPKPCHHPVANHRHGTYACYRHDACRCWQCSFAGSQYMFELRAVRANGQQAMVDPSKAAEHVKSLLEAGWTLRAISGVSGVSVDALRRFNSRTRRSRRIQADIEAAVLAVQHTGERHRLMVSAEGCVRRIRALATLGWAFLEIGARTGISRDGITRLNTGAIRNVRPETYAAICRVYDQLWDQAPPARQDGTRGRTIRYAAKQGWAPPLAWDDETIDDPNATPNTGDAQRDAESREAERLALWKRGMTDRQIAAATGRHHDAIRRWRLRHGLPSQERRAAS